MATKKITETTRILSGKRWSYRLTPDRKLLKCDESNKCIKGPSNNVSRQLGNVLAETLLMHNTSTDRKDDCGAFVISNFSFNILS